MFRRRWTRHPSHRASRSPRFEVRSYSLAYAYNQNLNDQEENATYPSPPHAMLAMSIMFIYFMPLSYALCIFSFNYLSVGFLSLPLHVRMWSEDAWSQGKVSQVQAKMARMRMWAEWLQSVGLGFIFFPFGYVLFQTPFFFLPFSLRWSVLGILCFVPFVLISKV